MHTLNRRPFPGRNASFQGSPGFIFKLRLPDMKPRLFACLFGTATLLLLPACESGYYEEVDDDDDGYSHSRTIVTEETAHSRPYPGRSVETRTTTTTTEDFYRP